MPSFFLSSCVLFNTSTGDQVRPKTITTTHIAIDNAATYYFLQLPEFGILAIGQLL